MRSLQDYIDIYSTIARRLGLQGDSVSVLTQMLANASYISEVENISYAQEASLEKATLVNSKIQHCMNEMYSVYRGTCPRVIIKFKPTKYFSFNVYDEIVSSNNFKIYYLGYYRKGSGNTTASPEGISWDTGFEYSPITIPPASTDLDTYTIVGLLAKETVPMSWKLDQSNTYYVNCLEENLSSDFWVKINGEYENTTRLFSEHIMNGSVFDLTLPSFGSRLYVADVLRAGFSRTEALTPANTQVNALYYKFSEVSSLNESELRRISMKGAELIGFDDTWIRDRRCEETSTGVIVIPEVPRDSITTIHYKANRDRYVNSILRSNSDVGIVLEEMFPEKIKSGGTNYEFTTTTESSEIKIYYVPYSKSISLTETEKQEFISSRTAYYITDSIVIEKGSVYNAIFNIDLDIYQNTNIDSEVKDILNTYGEKFNIDIAGSMEEIKSLISKISNVKQIREISVTYTHDNGAPMTAEEIENINPGHSYFQISYVINSIIQSRG